MNLSKIAVKVVSRNLASKQFKFTNTVLSQPKRFFTISTFRWNEKVEEEEEKEKKPENDLETKLQEQEKKFKELQQKYLLSLSDQENTRMIAKKDVESARKFALQNFALSLLEVPDTLNLALNSVPKEKQEEDGMKTFVQGIKMTETILLKVLKHYNITRMENQVGAEFNPQFHEAILKLKNEEMKSNTVQNVFKDGYLYHDRVLRAAQVSVVENEE